MFTIPFFSLFISNKFPTTWVYKYCFKLLYIYTRWEFPWDDGLVEYGIIKWCSWISLFISMCLGSWTRICFWIMNILIDHIHWRVNRLWISFLVYNLRDSSLLECGLINFRYNFLTTLELSFSMTSKFP